MISSFKTLARTFGETNNARKFYLAKDPDYRDDVYKVQAVSDATRFGFVYTCNNSQYPLSESLTLTLKGAQPYYPYPLSQEGPVFDINLEPGADHVLIFKQTEPSCSYGYKPVVHMRVKTTVELLEAA